MKQPINVVALTAIANTPCRLSRENDVEWGYNNSADIFRGLMAIPPRSVGYIDLSKAVNFLRSKWTGKMCGNANRELLKLERAIIAKKVKFQPDALEKTHP